jgi:hypothetical protein
MNTLLDQNLNSNQDKSVEKTNQISLYTLLCIPFLVFISNHRLTHLAPNQKCMNQTQSLKLPTVVTALSENLHKNSKRNIDYYL